MRPMEILVALRDAAMVFFAFLFDPPESSILAVKMEDVRVLTSRRSEMMVMKLMRRTTEEDIRRGRWVYMGPSTVAEVELSPKSIFTRNISIRGSWSNFLFSQARTLRD